MTDVSSKHQDINLFYLNYILNRICRHTKKIIKYIFFKAVLKTYKYLKPRL